VFQKLLEDKYFFQIIGMLEYDPEYPQQSHRKYFERVLHKVIIPMPEMKSTIDCIYRASFIKDVALARTLEDSTFNALSLYIAGLQQTVITFLSVNQKVIGEMFRLIQLFDQDIVDSPQTSKAKKADGSRKDGKGSDTPQSPKAKKADGSGNDSDTLQSPKTKKADPNGIKEKKSTTGQDKPKTTASDLNPNDSVSKSPTINNPTPLEGLLFLQELTTMVKGMYVENKTQFYKALSKNGFYDIFKLTLAHKQEKVRIAALSILMAALEHNPQAARLYCLRGRFICLGTRVGGYGYAW
jgi:protein phosphatase-4 regulatory subunit 3